MLSQTQQIKYLLAQLVECPWMSQLQWNPRHFYKCYSELFHPEKHQQKLQKEVELQSYWIAFQNSTRYEETDIHHHTPQKHANRLCKHFKF